MDEPVARYIPSDKQESGNYLEDDLDAPQVQRKIAAQEEARRIVMQKYPQFFETPEAVRARLAGTAKGTALSRAVDRTISNNRYYANAEIEGTLKSLQAQYDRQYESEVKSARDQRAIVDRENRNAKVQSEQSASILRTAQKTAQQTSVEGAEASYLSRAQQQQFNQAEAYLAAKFGTDPNSQSHFMQVTDYLEQLQNATPEERKQILGDLSDEAARLVDEPFDRKAGIIRSNLSMKLRQLNEKFGTLSDGEQFKLEQAVQSADTDTIAALDKGIEELFRSGTLNSGLLRRLADQVIEKRTLDVRDAEKVKELNLRGAKQALDQSTETLRGAADEDLYDLEYGTDSLSKGRIAARSEMESELYSERVQKGLLADLISGAGEYYPNGAPNTGQGLSSAMPRSPNGTPASSLASVRSTLPTISAPSGSSLDLARQAAAGTITPEQQAAARNALLMGSTPTPVSAVRSSPPTTTAGASKPIAPQTPVSTLRVTNPNTGVTYSGATAARLKARLDRV